MSQHSNKMNATNYLGPDEKLTKYNYEEWYPVVHSVLEANDLLDYIKNDIVTTITNGINAGTHTNDDLKRIKKEDSKARLVLLTSVTADIKRKIRNAKIAYKIMTRIKEFCDLQKVRDTSFYLYKLETMRAKDLDNALDIINEMIEIFDILEKRNHQIETLEGTRYIYASLPNDIKPRLPLKNYEKIEDYVKDGKEANEILKYYSGKSLKSETKQKKVEYLMDIDYI